MRKAQPIHNRTISWACIDRAGHDSRPKIPAGMLGACALVQLGARTRPPRRPRPYDRATIMTAACKAAVGIMERCGVSRAEALSTALKATWQVAKAPTTPPRTDLPAA